MPTWPVRLRRGPVLLIALSAVLGAAVFSHRVYLDFDRVRIKVIQDAQPATAGAITVTVPESPRLARLQAPVIVIARVANHAPRAVSIALSLNGARIGDATIAPNNARRVDIVLADTRSVRGGDVLTLATMPAGASSGDASAPAAKTTAASPDAGTTVSASAPSVPAGASAADMSGARWSLEYLEVATLHGSSVGYLTFVIVPRETSAYVSPALSVVVVVAILIGFLVARGEALPKSRVVRALQIGSMTLIAVIVVVLLVSGLVSPYKLLMAPRTFVLCVLVFTWPGLWRVYFDLRDAVDHGVMRPRSAIDAGGNDNDVAGVGVGASVVSWRRAAFDAAAVATVVLTAYVWLAQLMLLSVGGNYSGLLRIARTYVDRVPLLINRPDLTQHLFIIEDEGYDGQFVYVMALDPLLLAFKDEPIRYRDVVDTPPYRYGRIGFSLLTKLFSGDRPERYAQTMVWLILAASFLGAWLLAMIAHAHGYHVIWGLLYLLVPGFVASLYFGLPEDIAAAGLLGGYLLAVRGRFGWAAVPFAASLLVRETGVILVAALAIWYAWRLRDRRAGMLLAASTLPMIAWRVYVGWRLFADFHWSAFYMNPRTAGVPFVGIIELWRRIRGGTYFNDVPDVMTAGIWFPLLLIAGFAMGLYLLWRRRDGLAAAIVVYGFLAVSLTYNAVWVHIANAERVSYELFLLLIVAFICTARSDRLTRRVLGGFLACTLLYVWFASVDADLVRFALLS
jgi:hypothetical protein